MFTLLMSCFQMCNIALLQRSVRLLEEAGVSEIRSIRVEVMFYH
jgi:hypothetical protein